jgi:predicted DNA-binding transcriptional regulator AlpA
MSVAQSVPKAADALEELDELLTTEECAKLLRMSPHTLTDWRVDRRGPPFVRFGRAVRYPKRAALQFLADRLVRATGE